MEYIRVGTYKLEDVLPYVVFDKTIRKLKKNGIKKGTPEFREAAEKLYGEHWVKMYSQRYQVFKTKGTKCVKCGIEGTFFALERGAHNQQNTDRYHFNLYGLNELGEEVLITKDHILPKSKNGKNSVENYQPMCIHCNGIKSDRYEGDGMSETNKTTRKLASIQTIKEVKEHPNADKLDILTFQNIGWQCVSKKDEFKPGDTCCYFEIDSLIPIKPWSAFLEDKNKPGKPARLKTIRLRGEISQGLAVPVDVIPELKGKELKEGDDLSELLGIEKYEPPVPACLSGEASGPRPSQVPKTDEERIQAFPDLIQEFQGKLVYISQKIDGTSGTFAQIDNDFHVCGRNWCYKPNDDNSYWKVCEKYDIQKKLCAIRQETGKNYAVQGEVYGEGIQKNRLQISGQDLAVFNVIDLDGRRYLSFYEFKEFCERLQLQTVPILQIVKFEWQSIDELLELAKGKYSSGKPQEGIVIRPVHEFYSDVLKTRASFKVINNDFLLKGGD